MHISALLPPLLQDPSSEQGGSGGYELYQSSRTKRKSEDAVPKIREVLHLIRKDMFEVCSWYNLCRCLYVCLWAFALFVWVAYC